MTVYYSKKHEQYAQIHTKIEKNTRPGQMARELALIIHRAHQPGFDGARIVCEGHMDAWEGEHDWPCSEARELARVLGVDLG